MSFEFVTVDAGDGVEGSPRRRRSRPEDTRIDGSGTEIPPFSENHDVPGRQRVAYYHPPGCADGSDCDAEKINRICHNNSKNDEGVLIDDVFFGQPIGRPFLKGVYPGEYIDDEGNTFIDGKTRRVDSNDRASNPPVPGRGLCFNDAEEEDGLREWSENESRDPMRNDIVFMSRATTVRQSVRPKFATATRAVRRDPTLLAILNDDDTYEGRFFKSTTRYLRDPDDPSGSRAEEDVILAAAQELAVTCGARVPSDLTDEEKTVFEAFRKEKFDDLWSRSSLRWTLDRSRSRPMLIKLEKVAGNTKFAHGEANIQRRLAEIPVTDDQMLNAVRRGQSGVLKTLLDSAEKEDVRNVSAKLFADAIDCEDSDVKTTETLVAHVKVDVNTALTEDYREFSEGDVPLRMAIAGANPKPENFRALLKHPDIDVNVYEKNDQTVLWDLACIDYRKKSDWKTWGPMLEALLAHERTIVDATVDDGGTALHAACLTAEKIFSVRDEAVVRMLLDAGANPLARKSNGHTPIDEARGRRNIAIADLLTAATERVEGRRVTRSHRIKIDEARARLRRGTVRAWLGFGEKAQSLSFDPKGTRLSVAHARGIVELDADTGLRLGNETKFEKSMTMTTFSPNGTRIASWHGGTFEKFHLQRREPGTLAPEMTMRYENRRDDDDATFSDDGVSFTVADFNVGAVDVWSFDGKKWTKTKQMFTRPTALAFSRRVAGNEYLAVGERDRARVIPARVWDVRNVGNESFVNVGEWEGNEFTDKIAFSANAERIAAVSNYPNMVLKVFESTNGGVSWENTRLVFVKKSVSAFAFNPRNSTLLALVVGRNVELWSTQSVIKDHPGGTMLRRFENVEGPLAFSPDGTRLAMVSREDGTIVVENIVETFAKAFLENEKTRQTIDVRNPTTEHLEILKHARDVEIRVILVDDTLWELGAFLPNLERLSFDFFDSLEIHLKDLDSFVSLKKLVLPHLDLETLPSTIMNIRNLRELDVRGNKINVSVNHLKAFPKVLEKMPSLRLINIRDNEDHDGKRVHFPSNQFSEALRNKMNRRLLRIEPNDTIPSELVWGFDGETECENPNRLTDDEVRVKLNDTNEKPSLTHTGTQLLAFLLARYGGEYDDTKKKTFSKHFDEQILMYREDGAFEFALSRIVWNVDEDLDFRTVGGIGKSAVLSDDGVEEFRRWFVSDDFERDMRAYATFVAREDRSHFNDAAREEMGLSKLRANGFLYI